MGVDESVAVSTDLYKNLFLFGSLLIAVAALSALMARSTLVTNLGVYAGKYSSCATISGLHSDSQIIIDSITSIYRISSADESATGIITPSKDGQSYQFAWATYPGQILSEFNGTGYERFVFWRTGAGRGIEQEVVG